MIGDEEVIKAVSRKKKVDQYSGEIQKKERLSYNEREKLLTLE